MHKTETNLRLLATQRYQRGAALIIGLVLLMVLTILGISTMRTASLELLMAGNAQFKENAFQLAESGIENLLAQIDAGALAPLPVVNWEQDLGQTPITELGGDYALRQRFINDAAITTCGSLDTFAAYHFEVESMGRSQRDAESTQTRGYFLCGPAGL